MHTAVHSSAQYRTKRNPHSTAVHSIAQHCTAFHSIARHCTSVHGIAQRGIQRTNIAPWMFGLHNELGTLLYSRFTLDVQNSPIGLIVFRFFWKFSYFLKIFIFSKKIRFSETFLISGNTNYWQTEYYRAIRADRVRDVLRDLDNMYTCLVLQASDPAPPPSCWVGSGF